MLCLFVLYVILALWPPALQCQLPALLFDCVLLFEVILSGEPNRTKGEGWSTADSFKPPSNFIVGRPKAALLFWFFGNFTCSVLLCMVILGIYKYNKNSC